MIRKSKTGQATASTQGVLCGCAHVWPIRVTKTEICLLRLQIYHIFMLSI